MVIRRNNLYFILLAVAFGIFPAKGMAETSETHTRSNWYIGFGLGAGLDARYEINGEEITFDDWLEGLDKSPKTAINFKVGGTISPKTLLGFDGTAVRQEGTVGVDAAIQINNYFLMLTHFPYEEGLFFRVGGGLSNIVAEVDGDRDVVSGYGILGGVGYAFWLGKSFNLTLNLDHSRQYYSGGSDDPDRSQFTIAYVGFDWY